MPTLKFYALGSPRLEQSSDIIPVGRRKALAMLANLAITGQPQTRESLLALLWPEYDPSGGRANLRRDLSYLRRTLGGEHVVADRTQMSLNLEAGLWVDVRHFRSLLATAQEHNHGEEQLCRTCEEALTKAAELYAGDFMAGFSLPDAPDFDEWLFFERESLRQALAAALQQLLNHHGERGEYETAIGYGRRWLALDSLHEPAHRELMKLYAWSGQQAAALRQYEECVRLLDEELGIAPEEETAMLYEKIRLRQLEAPLLQEELRPERAVTTSPPGPETSAAKALTPPVTPSSAHNLPFQATPFIGREDELAELEELLSNPQKRLISIVAPGGMGKTRLSLAAAEGHLEMGQYPDGVYFIALAPLSDPDHIPAAMADAFDLPLETGGQTRTSRQQVLDYLREKRLLLVMDNFEHLLVGAELVNDVIQGAPQVQVIVTSRERLQLRSEQVYAIQGLEFPEWETPEVAAEYTAVKLFLQSAAQVQQDFQLEQDDLTYLSRICRLVGGMPLAIELAAGWVDTLSLEEIAAEIRQSLDFLETELRDVPERQRRGWVMTNRPSSPGSPAFAAALPARPARPSPALLCAR